MELNALITLHQAMCQSESHIVSRGLYSESEQFGNYEAMLTAWNEYNAQAEWLLPQLVNYIVWLERELAGVIGVSDDSGDDAAEFRARFNMQYRDLDSSTEITF